MPSFPHCGLVLKPTKLKGLQSFCDRSSKAFGCAPPGKVVEHRTGRIRISPSVPRSRADSAVSSIGHCCETAVKVWHQALFAFSLRGEGMALYRYDQFVRKATVHDEFDKLYTPGSTASWSGIYRCEVCGREVVHTREKPLPPQTHHTHPQNQPIRWRMIVTDHNPS